MLTDTLTQLAVFAAAAVPGYFVAAAMMDRMGRKPIQVLGFAVMAGSFLAMALIPGIEKLIFPFLIIYGISYFFTEFGPNATTFVYPAEIFPVETRTTGHGIAAATGKVGGFFGVFTFPILMAWHGLLTAELAAAAASVLGLDRDALDAARDEGAEPGGFECGTYGRAGVAGDGAVQAGTVSSKRR